MIYSNGSASPAAGDGHALKARQLDTKMDTSAQRGKTAKIMAADLRQEGQPKSFPDRLSGVVTPQKELDAFNVVNLDYSRSPQ